MCCKSLTFLFCILAGKRCDVGSSEVEVQELTEEEKIPTTEVKTKEEKMPTEEVKTEEVKTEEVTKQTEDKSPVEESEFPTPAQDFVDLTKDETGRASPDFSFLKGERPLQSGYHPCACGLLTDRYFCSRF